MLRLSVAVLALFTIAPTKSVRFAEAPGRGVSILDHASGSRGANAYRAIAQTLHDDAPAQ